MKPRSPVKVPRLTGEVIRKSATPMMSARRKRRRRPPGDMCEDAWGFSQQHKSPEAELVSVENVLFHPSWSNGHAACRADRPLNRQCIHYWEVAFTDRVFGTAMQVGLVTAAASLHADSFLCNLLGQDQHSWGFSHKGYVWHNGLSTQVCQPLSENQPVVLGLLYNGPEGTLSLYKDDELLGVVATGLENVAEDLYPAVSSTAAKTSMQLLRRRRSFVSLQDRCRAVVTRFAPNPSSVSQLPLPPGLQRWLVDSLPPRSVA